VGRLVGVDGRRGHGRHARAAAQLLEKRGAYRSQIEDRFKPPGGELLHLRVGQVDARPLSNAGADVAHDLLDVHVVAPPGLLARPWLGRLRGGARSFPAATVRTAPAAMKMSAPAALGA